MNRTHRAKMTHTSAAVQLTTPAWQRFHILHCQGKQKWTIIHMQHGLPTFQDQVYQNPNRIKSKLWTLYTADHWGRGIFERLLTCLQKTPCKTGLGQPHGRISEWSNSVSSGNLSLLVSIARNGVRRPSNFHVSIFPFHITKHSHKGWLEYSLSKIPESYRLAISNVHIIPSLALFLCA